MCLFSLSATAQVKGIIYGSKGETDKKETLYGAKVRLLNAKGGAITGEEGKFELILPKDLPDTLIFSARGYFSDTVIVTKKDRYISFSITLLVKKSNKLSPILIPSISKSLISSAKDGVWRVKRIRKR